MSNMGYCRFQNTEKDLSDCIDALNEDGDLSSFSDTEQEAAHRILALCADFIQAMEMHGVSEKGDS